MTLFRQFKINAEINCAISFTNICNQNNIAACVGFNNGLPPLIFDCDDEKEFTQCLQSGVSVYKQ